jgi:hypothetical protein
VIVGIEQPIPECCDPAVHLAGDRLHHSAPIV